MLDNELEETVKEAFGLAQGNAHQYLTVEHLLLALTNNPTAEDILSSCGVKIERLKEELETFVKKNVPVSSGSDNEQIAQPTISFHRVFQRAIFHVRSSERQNVSGANVLVAIFGEIESQSVYLLKKHNVERLDVINYITHGISKRNNDVDYFDTDDQGLSDKKTRRPKSALKKFTQNLNDLAERKQIDPLVGREEELIRIAQILCRRRKNNPLLVGNAGVGKTAIIEGLARHIVEQKVPEIISKSTIFMLDMGTLLAGTRYRGDFEKRFKELLEELNEYDNAILFIDEVHTVIGAGSTSSGVMDASNLLKPLLTSGNLRCIGSTTFQEFRGIFEKDRALARRFQKVDILEPSIDETYQILKGLKSYFEEHHDIKYTDKSLHSAATLASRYINDRQMPDKAIDVIDEAGAAQRLKSASKRKKQIDVNDIENIIASIVRVPPETVSSSDVKILAKLEENLKHVIFGQDHAVKTLASKVRMSRAGLGEQDKPICSLLFAGPTGVGKTEVARQVSIILGLELIRYDMSEYMERHTVSRLIGAPPGYIGFDQGGLLTEAITQNPHSVVLLDEIEKAHPDVFNILLQVMDHGTLTDNNGRHADFRNTILIMTTNAGAELISRRSMGFAEQDNASDANEYIRKAFSPEFRNRLDGVIQFNHLSEKVIFTIVDKFLVELQSQLDSKKIELRVSKQAREWLVNKGYDKVMGARPMARAIREYIKTPLSDELLFGVLHNSSGIALVDVAKDKNSLTVKVVQQEPKSKPSNKSKKLAKKKAYEANN